MRTLITTILISICVFQNIQGQNKFYTKLSVGTDGIQLQADIKAFNKFNYIGELGLAVEGIDINLNDFLIGLGLNYEIVNNQKQILSIGFTTGLTYVNHELFSKSLYYLSPQLRYSRFFGKKKKHGVSVSAGYKFGSTDYLLSNSNEFFSTEMIQSYKLQPVIFNLGYCIRF